MKWLLYSGIGLVALIAVVATVGWMLPKGHRASRSVVLTAPPAQVFAIISDFSRYAEWRSDVTRVEMLPDDGRGLLFREHGKNGAITYRVEASEPGVRMVTRIADTNLAFGGSWTYGLTAATGGATALTITEDGEVYNPIFRFMSKFVISQHATIDAYQAALKARVETLTSSPR